LAGGVRRSRRAWNGTARDGPPPLCRPMTGIGQGAFRSGHADSLSAPLTCKDRDVTHLSVTFRPGLYHG
jgi:hypothetical protein